MCQFRNYKAEAKLIKSKVNQAVYYSWHTDHFIFEEYWQNKTKQNNNNNNNPVN